MNDKFKFRCYNKFQKKMFDVKCMSYIDGIVKRIEVQNEERILIFNEWKNNIDNTVLMQCTGLKDKNGKLIYEGDIVRFIYGNKKRLGYVEENKTVWSITNSNFCQGAWCSGALVNLYETCEVIGNIYENKELLESEGK